MNASSHTLVDRMLCPVLRPFVRLCVERSVRFPELVGLLERLFVEVGKESLSRRGIGGEASSLAELTGLSLEQLAPYEQAADTFELSSERIGILLTAWETDPRFSSEDGQPRDLTINGVDSEFEYLCRQCGLSCPKKRLIQYLADNQFIALHGNLARLLQTEVRHTACKDKGLNLLFRDVEALSSAVTENLNRVREIGNLHLRTEFDNIPEEKVEIIRKWILEEGRLFHKRARAYLASHDLDCTENAKTEGGRRVVLGAFSWTS